MQQIKEKGKGKISILGIHTFDVTDSSGKILRRKIIKNLIADVGMNLLGQYLISIVTNPQGINYCALGTGSTAVAVTDTALEAEGARKLIGSKQVSDNIVTAAFYFGPDIANGTWTRFATFMDGTDTVDTGTLFSHVAVDITKASGEGLTVTSQYTITSS